MTETRGTVDSLGPTIIDTNVVVAALLTRDADTPVAPLLRAALDGRLRCVLSPALLAEYRAVLLRPTLCALHRLTPEEVDEVLTELAQHAIVLTPPAGPPAPDPGDQMLWDLLAARPELRLISGDRALQQAADMRGRVLSPREALGQV